LIFEVALLVVIADELPLGLRSILLHLCQLLRKRQSGVRRFV
jgi:hypothetical protein